MKLINGVVYLEDSVGFSPDIHGVKYKDTNGNNIYVPIKLLIRLYEGHKYNYEKKLCGVWEEYCDNLFKD